MQLAIGFDILERFQALSAACAALGAQFLEDKKWYDTRIAAIEAAYAPA